MWSQGDFTTLVAWFTVVIVCVFGGFSGMCKKFMAHYEMLRRGGAISKWSPKMRSFKFMWSLTAALLIASGALFTIGYANCVQDYYIVVCAVSLFQLVCMLGWGHLFCKMGHMKKAMGAMTMVVASSIVVTTMMALSLASPNATCPLDRTSGWIATFFWGVPTLWYLCLLSVNYEWCMNLHPSQLPVFWHLKLKYDIEASNYDTSQNRDSEESRQSSSYGNDDDDYHDRRNHASYLRASLLKPMLKE